MASRPTFGESGYRWSGKYLFECVWYVVGRAGKLGYDYETGNACDWSVQPGRTPQRGDTVVFTGGSTGYGHVGFIESVSGNTAVVTHGWYKGSIPGNQDRSSDYGNFVWYQSNYTLGGSLAGCTFKGYHPGGGGGGSEPEPQPIYGWVRASSPTGWQWDQSVPSGTQADGVAESRTVYRVFDYETNTWSDLLYTKPE